MALSEITVPQTNVNDESARVVEWLIADGDRVSTGQHLVTIETSKAAEEIEASQNGVVRIKADVASEVPVGGVLAWVADTEDELPQAVLPADQGGELRITDKARVLAAEMGVDPTTLEVRGIITERHIRQAAEGATTPLKPAVEPSLDLEVAAEETVPLSRIQRSVSRAVRRSLTETASAYLLGEADITQALNRLDALVDDEGVFVSVTDLAIYQAAQALKRFPRLNAALVGDAVHQYAEINVGATVEVDNDLYVVNIHGADTLSLVEIAERRQLKVMELFRGKPDPEALARGTFTVTVLEQSALHHQIPVIFPTQAGILGLGGVRDTVVLGPDGASVNRKVVGLTVSYDHRFVNGAYAARFLQDIADCLASPDFGG